MPRACSQSPRKKPIRISKTSNTRSQPLLLAIDVHNPPNNLPHLAKYSQPSHPGITSLPRYRQPLFTLILHQHSTKNPIPPSVHCPSYQPRSRAFTLGRKNLSTHTITVPSSGIPIPVIKSRPCITTISPFHLPTIPSPHPPLIQCDSAIPRHNSAS